MQQTGRVKWFNDAKGFGFVAVEAEERDHFVHYSQIVGGGFKSLRMGQLVCFDAVTTEKGLQAQNVRVVKTADGHG